MRRFENKNILVINDSPIQTRDLKNFLVHEKNATVYIAEDLKSALLAIKDNKIEIILMEFTMPKNFKYKINRFCKKFQKELPYYLVINTRILIAKNRKIEEEEKQVFTTKRKIKEREVYIKEISEQFNISENVSELYEKPMSLELNLGQDNTHHSDFLEIFDDGIVCALPFEVAVNSNCQFIVSNFLDIEQDISLEAKITECSVDEDDDKLFILYLEIKKSSQAKWKKIIEHLSQKQMRANEFIKAANE